MSAPAFIYEAYRCALLSVYLETFKKKERKKETILSIENKVILMVKIM
jgi:hypothetical protein